MRTVVVTPPGLMPGSPSWYFADARAGEIFLFGKPVEATTTTPEDGRLAAGIGNPAASGVRGGEGEGR